MRHNMREERQRRKRKKDGEMRDDMRYRRKETNRMMKKRLKV